MENLLSGYLVALNHAAKPPSSRLRGLSNSKFDELLRDLQDEVNRRTGVLPCARLEPSSEFTGERNEARAQFSSLSISHFGDLIFEALQELKRREREGKTETLQSLKSLERTAKKDTAHQSVDNQTLQAHTALKKFLGGHQPTIVSGNKMKLEDASILLEDCQDELLRRTENIQDFLKVAFLFRRVKSTLKREMKRGESSLL